MSFKIRNALLENDLRAEDLTREQLLNFNPPVDFDSFRNGDEETVKREIRTQQSFKDSSDINKIIKRHQVRVSTSHLVRFPEEFYGEFADVDLLDAHNKIEKINGAFAELPSEVRSEFNQDPFAFAKFVNDPANRGKLAELLPKIAEPDKFFPNPANRGGQGAGAATAPSIFDPVPAEPPPAAAPQGASAPESASPPPAEPAPASSST